MRQLYVFSMVRFRRGARVILRVLLLLVILGLLVPRLATAIGEYLFPPGERRIDDRRHPPRVVVPAGSELEFWVQRLRRFYGGEQETEGN